MSIHALSEFVGPCSVTATGAHGFAEQELAAKGARKIERFGRRMLQKTT